MPILALSFISMALSLKVFESDSLFFLDLIIKKNKKTENVGCAFGLIMVNSGKWRVASSLLYLSSSMALSLENFR